jgi:hypothetical protein
MATEEATGYIFKAEVGDTVLVLVDFYATESSARGRAAAL